jgi:hypothetical protein
VDECTPLTGGDIFTSFVDFIWGKEAPTVGWCRFQASTPVLKAPLASALETAISYDI